MVIWRNVNWEEIETENPDLEKAWLEYDAIVQPAWAKYEAILQQAFWNSWKEPANRKKKWR